jgi:hypothetical protein
VSNQHFLHPYLKGKTMTAIYHDYSIGHPWYFLLGGPVPRPSAIRAQVIEAKLTGYRRDELAQFDCMAEPQRSAAHRKASEEVKAELRKDISRYRQCVVELHRYRETQDGSEKPRCAADVHTNLSLKVSHMINGFAHLYQLDGMEQQTDLFDLL